MKFYIKKKEIPLILHNVSERSTLPICSVRRTGLLMRKCIFFILGLVSLGFVGEMYFICSFNLLLLLFECIKYNQIQYLGNTFIIICAVYHKFACNVGYCIISSMVIKNIFNNCIGDFWQPINIIYSTN